MAKHYVYATLPYAQLGKTDAFFEIYEDNKKLGRITISKGAIEWYPANAKIPVKRTWKQFDKIMKSK